MTLILLPDVPGFAIGAPTPSVCSNFGSFQRPTMLTLEWSRLVLDFLALVTIRDHHALKGLDYKVCRGFSTHDFLLVLLLDFFTGRAEGARMRSILADEAPVSKLPPQVRLDSKPCLPRTAHSSVLDQSLSHNLYKTQR